MALSASKVWIAGEVLLASDLVAEFANIYNNGQSVGFPRTGSSDFDGNELILDADGDTSITSDTDDQIDFRVGGTDRVRMIISGLNVVSGTLQENGVNIVANAKRQAGMVFFKAQNARAMAMENAGNMTLFHQVYG